MFSPIDDSFPLTQFLIEGFTTPYRLDRNGSGGGILVYIHEDIPSKFTHRFLKYEGIFPRTKLTEKEMGFMLFLQSSQQLY